MRWAVRHAAAALVISVAGACTSAPPPVPPLEPADFALAGLPPDADSVEVRMSFGDPDSVVYSENPYEAVSPLASWYYEGLIVRFAGGAVPASYVVTGGDEATARGIRVNDAAARVLERYGEPVYRYDAIWTYVDPGEATDPYVLEFLVQSDIVARIHMGRVED